MPFKTIVKKRIGVAIEFSVLEASATRDPIRLCPIIDRRVVALALPPHASSHLPGRRNAGTATPGSDHCRAFWIITGESARRPASDRAG